MTTPPQNPQNQGWAESTVPPIQPETPPFTPVMDAKGIAVILLALCEELSKEQDRLQIIAKSYPEVNDTMRAAKLAISGVSAAISRIAVQITEEIATH